MVDLARVHEVAAYLCGTCQGADELMTPEERNNTEFLSALDECVRYCDNCGWWLELEEFTIADNGEEMCADCAEDMKS